MADIEYIFARGNNQGREGLGLVGVYYGETWPRSPGANKLLKECQGSVNP
jgi:hypothetical protein